MGLERRGAEMVMPADRAFGCLTAFIRVIGGSLLLAVVPASAAHAQEVRRHPVTHTPACSRGWAWYTLSSAGTRTRSGPAGAPWSSSPSPGTRTPDRS